MERPVLDKYQDRIVQAGEKLDRWANVAAFAVGLFVILSTLASTNWFSDFLSNLHAHVFVLAVPVFVYLLARRHYATAAFLAVASIVLLLPLIPFFFGSHPGEVTEGPVVRVVAANVLYVNDEFGEVINEIEDLDADIIGFHEVTPLWEDELAAVDEEYDFRSCVARDDTQGLCVFSRLDTDGEFFDLGGAELPTFVGTTQVEDTELVISSVHGLFPAPGAWTRDRNSQLRELADVIADTDGCNVTIVGDFNATPTNPIVTELAGDLDLTDASVGTGYGKSWSSKFFPGWLGGLRIDHALVDDRVEVLNHELVDITGSDHKAVVVDLRLPPCP